MSDYSLKKSCCIRNNGTISRGISKPRDRFEGDLGKHLISRYCTARDTEITELAYVSWNELARERDINACTGRDRGSEHQNANNRPERITSRRGWPVPRGTPRDFRNGRNPVERYA